MPQKERCQSGKGGNVLNKLDILKRYFGYRTFRPGQEQVIDAILEKRDVLGIMPTGAGKSLCYQVPALMLPGVCLVISPLISLMKDQVMALKAAGIPAAYLNASLTENQMHLAMERAAAGAYKMIYVAPERLRSPGFRYLVSRMKISLVAVDEAHCVSQWGHEFRPEYRQIAAFVESLPERPHYCAFTATATDEVRRDMIELLGLQKPYITVTGFDRPNLFFEVMKPSDRDAALLEICRERRGETGIVYCMSRRNVETVCEMLKRAGLSATRYHAGLTDEERKSNQEDFQYDRARIMVATNAFGMGIDKSNVRYVIHYNLPLSMEAYYQEAGRAGRDGMQSRCILLFSRQDIGLGEYILENSQGNVELSPQEEQKLRAIEERRFRDMQHYAQTGGCLRRCILGYFGEKAPVRCNACSNCKRLAEKPATSSDRTVRKAREFISPESAWMAPRRPVSVPRTQPSELAREEGTLYGYLTQVRAILAANAGLPPYIVCSDQILRNMSETFPMSIPEIAEIEGMGYAKARAYGAAFVRAVKSWVRQNVMPESEKGSSWTASDQDRLRSQRAQGKTVSEIALQMGISLQSAARQVLALEDEKNPESAVSVHASAERGGRAPSARTWSPRETNWLQSLHMRSWTVHSIARQLGRSDMEVVHRLREIGLQPRYDLPDEPDDDGLEQ